MLVAAGCSSRDAPGGEISKLLQTTRNKNFLRSSYVVGVRLQLSSWKAL
jgi:hypothetical protein